MLGALIGVGLLLLSTLALYILNEHQASGAWQAVSTAQVKQNQPPRHGCHCHPRRLPPCCNRTCTTVYGATGNDSLATTGQLLDSASRSIFVQARSEVPRRGLNLNQGGK